MTIQEMKKRKLELGYSNAVLSRLSGVPVPTIQKILSGTTTAPRQKTIEALTRVLRLSGDRSADTAPSFSGVEEPGAAYAVQKKIHTIEEIYALPEGVHAELIDGQIYYMSSPTRFHQKITGELYLAIANHIRQKGEKCKVYIPPFAVFLFGDDSTYVEPDLTVVCDLDKLDHRGCVGAPDWIVEVISPSSRRMDGLIKLMKYRQAGVRQYWLIDPDTRTVGVYHFSDHEEDETVMLYTFDDAIPSGLFPELSIRLSDVL